MSVSDLMRQVQSIAGAKDDMQDMYEKTKDDKEQEAAKDNLKSIAQIPNALLEINLTKKLGNLANEKLIKPAIEKTRKFIKSKRNDLTGEDGELTEEDLQNLSPEAVGEDLTGLASDAGNKLFQSAKSFFKNKFKELTGKDIKDEDLEDVSPDALKDLSPQELLQGKGQGLLDSAKNLFKGKFKELTGKDLGDGDLQELSGEVADSLPSSGDFGDYLGQAQGFMQGSARKYMKDSKDLFKKKFQNLSDEYNENVEEVEPETLGMTDEHFVNNLARQSEEGTEMQDFANLPESNTIEDTMREVSEQPENIAMNTARLQPSQGLQETKIQGEIQAEDPETILGQAIESEASAGLSEFVGDASEALAALF